ncbi:hypothetical protein FTX61_01750 [Nitriliruptoraceae bacterium ZYF776]|nr:hypothetical protein [Profundirhabdus halotolerans]
MAEDARQGVQFPLVDGSRSTTAAGRTVLAEAARAVDPRLADRIAAERAWHQRYHEHVRDLVAAELRAAEDGVQVPRTGLDALYGRFEFHRDREVVGLADAADAPVRTELRGVEVRGTGRPETVLSVPYRGDQLTGEALLRQLDAWTAAGTVEPSFAEGIGRVVTHPEWLDLCDLTVVVLGAGSEMGPLAELARWGATIVPIDLPRPALWERVLATLRGGAGRAIVPVRRPAEDHELAEAAGVDLLTELPEAAAFLDTVPGPLVIGTYVYADGGDNVRVSLAADALTVHVLRSRQDPVSLAALLTPTDVYPVPPEVVRDAQERFARGGVLPAVARRATIGRGFAPNYRETITTPAGATFGLADTLVLQQGPNYALAKRLARWRLRLARRDGVPVSANVAPATRTRSVTSNRVLAAAYAGAHHFGVEVFEPATSTTLMAALLVRDLRDPDAAGRPEASLPHSLGILADGAAHGGLWRIGYAPRSVLPLAAALGLPRARR